RPARGSDLAGSRECLNVEADRAARCSWSVRRMTRAAGGCDHAVDDDRVGGDEDRAAPAPGLTGVHTRAAARLARIQERTVDGAETAAATATIGAAAELARCELAWPGLTRPEA